MTRGLAVAALVALGGCARGAAIPASASTPKATQSTSPTPPKATWLCRPGRNDPCTTADLTVTVLGAEGQRSADAFHAEPLAPADCFYVYPTVDLDLVPRNHEDLADRRNVLSTTLAQVGRFGALCRLWVPMYRQVTLGMYLQPKDVLERGLAVAYEDVDRAFAEYLVQAPPGRPIVLIGHSQGAEMITRLLQRRFETNAALRARLVLAIAAGGWVHTPDGRAEGGTFPTIPLCTRPLETGCVVAFRTHAAGERVDPGSFAPPPGERTACVDPAALDMVGVDFTRTRRLSRTFLPSAQVPVAPPIDTPFLELPDLYAARCHDHPSGYRYLEVGVQPRAADVRGEGPIDLHADRFLKAHLGLHVLDLQLPQGDLIDLVQRRLARH